MNKQDEFDKLGIRAIHEGIIYKNKEVTMRVQGDSHVYPYLAYNGAYIEIRYDDHTDYVDIEGYGRDWFLASEYIII